MAFAINMGSISAGATGTWWFDYGGADKGFQIAEGHPYNPGGKLWTLKFGKENIAGYGFRYWVTIWNSSPYNTNWALIGGGVV
jgi:hypothetical protein